MQLTTTRRPGRPATRATTPQPAMLTLRLDPTTKNLLIDLAEACDISLSEYVTNLINQNAHTPNTTRT